MPWLPIKIDDRYRENIFNLADIIMRMQMRPTS